MLEKTLRFFEKYVIPRGLYRFFQPAYHYLLAAAGALLYRFPSRNLFVVGVTGTKGKSTTVELVHAILENAGYKTALFSTIRFKTPSGEERNLHKMTMPGRFFVQKFLRRAVQSGATHVVMEMTSEGARFFRHKFIDLDALVVTNLTPEHIESHGSFENYKGAKLSLARALEESPKRPRALVVNGDMEHAAQFMTYGAETKISFSMADAKNIRHDDKGMGFDYEGVRIESALRGDFNTMNILAALSFAKSEHIPLPAAAEGIKSVASVRGRLERVEAGQPFEVIVDYAHTADSLEKVYLVFKGRRKICVLGGTGGGRDKWKRPEMGKIAANHCDEIFLTDEDPYDENPRQIVIDIQKGILHKKTTTIMDRRLAMREAFKTARTGDVVIITGKGTDPFIMGPNGTKTPWDDATVAREELSKLTFN